MLGGTASSVILKTRKIQAVIHTELSFKGWGKNSYHHNLSCCWLNKLILTLTGKDEGGMASWSHSLWYTQMKSASCKVFSSCPWTYLKWSHQNPFSENRAEGLDCSLFWYVSLVISTVSHNLQINQLYYTVSKRLYNIALTLSAYNM